MKPWEEFLQLQAIDCNQYSKGTRKGGKDKTKKNKGRKGGKGKEGKKNKKHGKEKKRTRSRRSIERQSKYKVRGIIGNHSKKKNDQNSHYVI